MINVSMILPQAVGTRARHFFERFDLWSPSCGGSCCVDRPRSNRHSPCGNQVSPPDAINMAWYVEHDAGNNRQIQSELLHRFDGSGMNRFIKFKSEADVDLYVFKWHFGFRVRFGFLLPPPPRGGDVIFISPT